MRIGFAMVFAAMLASNSHAFEYMKDYSTHAQKVLEMNAGEMTLLSNIILSNAYAQMDAAAGAGKPGEVSQAAERATLKMLDVLVKQNEEVIRLLRALASEKGSAPATPSR